MTDACDAFHREEEFSAYGKLTGKMISAPQSYNASHALQTDSKRPPNLPGDAARYTRALAHNPSRFFKPVGKVARFRQIDLEMPNVHHDALEFADGSIVRVHALRAGQHATVLQMPASSRPVPAPERAPSRGLHGFLSR